MVKKETSEINLLAERVSVTERDINKMSDSDIIKYCLGKIQDSVWLDKPDEIIGLTVIAWRALKQIEQPPSPTGEPKSEKRKQRKSRKAKTVKEKEKPSTETSEVKQT